MSTSVTDVTGASDVTGTTKRVSNISLVGPDGQDVHFEDGDRISWEERSIERSVRQEGKREVARQLDEVGHDAEVSVVAPPVIVAPVTAKDAPVTDAPPACPRCGSERSGKGDGGACRDEGGCRTRRCRRRHDESSRVRRERRLSQCPSITGSVRSIRFCTMHQGHDGLHLNGATEWDDSGELRDGFAVALADATREGRVSS